MNRTRNNSGIIITILLIITILMGCLILILLSDRNKGNDKSAETASHEEMVVFQDNDNSHRIAQGYSTSDVDELVKLTRDNYYATEENPENLEAIYKEDDRYVFFYNKYGNIEKVTFDLPDGKYRASYYYANDELYFAFIRNEAQENRFYINNGLVYRWIDENGVIHDCETENVRCRQWVDTLFDEAEKIDLIDRE